MTRRIGLFVFPDFQILDATGPLAAFEMPTRTAAPSPYALEVISITGGLVRSSSGLRVETTAALESSWDTLIVAGGEGTRAAATCERTLGFVRGVQARRTASVCSGAYILAAAGLLDGRRATTHWRRAQDLQRRFPAIKVDLDAIFIRDGAIWTSAGITAGIDLALALIEDDLGEAVARRTAQELVVFHRRPGGQSQHSALLELAPKTDRIGRALAFARSRLDQPLTVEQLASEAGLSARQFSRLFAQETGQTPAKAVERLRTEAARVAVEARTLSLEQIAREVGFGDTDRMRDAFLRAFGQPPQALRRAPARKEI